MKNKILIIFICIVLCSVLFGCVNGKDGADEKISSETERAEIPEETEGVTEGCKESESVEAETEAVTLAEETEEVTIDEVSEETAAPQKNGYVAPEGWYDIRYETGVVDGGDYKLTDGVMGLKVYYVEKKLGLRPYTWGYYTERLSDEVAYFQTQNVLDYTGSVNLETWLCMGFTEEEWHTLGTYVSPVRVTPENTAEEMIEIFIERAKEYLRTPFVVGASGKPGQGVDCSGLVLQCMYSVGIYPDGLDPVQHSTIEEYNSRLMWADQKFKEVSVYELLPGDLVFYRRPWSNTVCHVAIYLGDNECIEALYSDVEILPLYKDDVGYTIKGCKRIIDRSSKVG